MRSRSILAAGFAATVVFVGAGCGGAGAPAGAQGGAAVVAPADTVAFVAVDTDVSSTQWQALDGVLAKLSAGRLLAEFEQLQPALGPEVDLVVLPSTSGGKPEAVLLAQPTDPSELDAELAKLSTKPLTARVGGWTAVSESKDALAALTGASGHLSDSSVYREAQAKLAGDALVRAYANGAEARQLVASLAAAAPAGKQLVWAAADVVASGNGLRVHGFVRQDGGQAPQPYDAALLDRIPGDTLAVADFVPQHHQAAAAAPSSALGAALRSVAGSLSGETAVYVGPAAPLPAVTLVTQGSDPQPLVSALHALLGNVGSALPSGKTGSFDLGALLGGLQLSHAVVGSDVVVSTSQAAVDAFRGNGRKLGDAPTFKAAGVPAQTTGFVYVDLKDAGPLLQGLARLAGGAGATGMPSLGALRSLTAYGSGSSGGISSFTAYLEVQ